ncbi:MAG: quinol:cytochrome C oxidoreductase [Tepidisphaeraceae bacterium]
MSTQSNPTSGDSERLNLREHAWPLYRTSQVVGVVGLLAAVALGYRDYLHVHNYQRFLYAYLISYMFFLAIALGGLSFTMLQQLTKAGWSVNVRRIAEWFASSMPVMAALSAPIIISVFLTKGDLYHWAGGTVRGEPLEGFKRVYLSPAFFTARLIFYFAVWSILGVWFWKKSTLQDQNGDWHLTQKMAAVAAPGMVLFGITLTGGAFDLIMSLDPHWSSTIFGVYYFAECAIASYATITLTAMFLQCKGFLKESITVEHFHDLGKYLFAFTFFYGYIAYSQYMLQWYGNMPEETAWWLRRGATTVWADTNYWTGVALALLFGHILIPFAGLLSRHVKRNRKGLAFWAVWQLCFVWVDMFFLIMPELNGGFHIGPIEVAAFLGIGGIFVSVALRRAAHGALRPLQDPRLMDSLEFQNI